MTDTAPGVRGMPLQMKTYLATEYRHDGRYSVKVYAASERDAKEICLARGWEFDGELIAEIPADKTTPAQMDEFIRRRNEGKADA